MPRFVNFPGCCTAKVMVGFGEERTAEVDFGYNYNVADLSKEIEQWRRYGIAIITATLTQNQVKGRQVLTDLGFKRTRDVSKGAHPENTLSLFTLLLDEWDFKKFVEPKKGPARFQRAWVRNRGRKSVPTGSVDTLVEVRLRDGTLVKGFAGVFRWDHDGGDGDIMSYRIIE